jgi:hypothetical protein
MVAHQAPPHACQAPTCTRPAGTHPQGSPAAGDGKLHGLRRVVWGGCVGQQLLRPVADLLEPWPVRQLRCNSDHVSAGADGMGEHTSCKEQRVGSAGARSNHAVCSPDTAAVPQQAAVLTAPQNPQRETRPSKRTRSPASRSSAAAPAWSPGRALSSSPSDSAMSPSMIRRSAARWTWVHDRRVQQRESPGVEGQRIGGLPSMSQQGSGAATPKLPAVV